VRTFHLPPLDALFSGNIRNVLLDGLGHGAPGPQCYPETAIWFSLVKLTDKAIREYEAARVELGAYVNSPRTHVSPYFTAADHLENTVGAAHRALLHGQELRASGFGRAAPPATVGQLDRLRLLRNRIEHSDQRLRSGNIKEGSAFVLSATERSLHFGDVRLTYRDLSSCIRKAYRQVEAIRGPS